MIAGTSITQDVAERELDYALKCIDLLPTNESPWNYINGILMLTSKSLKEFPSVLEKIEFYANEKENIRFALVALLDLKKTDGLRQECLDVRIYR